MRASILFVIVLAIHGMAVSGFFLMQGCATRPPRIPVSQTESVPLNESTTASEAQASSETNPPQVSRTVTSTTTGRSFKMPPPRNPTPIPKVQPMTEVPGAAGPHAGGVPSTPYTPDQPAASAKAEPPVDTRGASVYKVKPGDMLSKIAYRNGISSKELAEYNSLSSPDALRVDQKLLIPPYATPRKASVSPRAPSALPETSPITRTAAGGTYMVKRGDHLTGIARKHGVTISAIRAANNMIDDRIYEGKTIVIPGGGASTGIFAPKKPATRIPILGNSPEGGVQKINSISVGTRNNVKDPVLINSDLGTPVAAGGVSPFLSLPSVEPPASATPEPSTLAQAFEYVVQDGETLEDIARAFIVSADDVRTLNALDPKAVVKPGQTLKIPPSIF